MKKIYIYTLLVISIVTNICLGSALLKSEDIDPIIFAEEVNVTDTLSDWELFTLALMKVESNYDPNAVSSVGAMGYFQITPIYVKEVNRVHHTDYTFDQVTDFSKAYEIFDLMQKAHNPSYDMDKALTLHNGDHLWYKKRVYSAMNDIRLYEDMRKKLKDI